MNWLNRIKIINSSIGRWNCGKDTRSIPYLNRNADRWMSHAFSRASPVVLRSRPLSSFTSCKASSPKLPRVSTAKGQKRHWLGKLEYKSFLFFSALGSPSPGSARCRWEVAPTKGVDMINDHESLWHELLLTWVIIIAESYVSRYRQHRILQSGWKLSLLMSAQEVKVGRYLSL